MPEYLFMNEEVLVGSNPIAVASFSGLFFSDIHFQHQLFGLCSYCIIFCYYVIDFVVLLLYIGEHGMAVQIFILFLGGAPTSICCFFHLSVRLSVLSIGCKPYLRNHASCDHDFCHT